VTIAPQTGGSWTLRLTETEGEVDPDPEPPRNPANKSHCDIHIPHKDWAAEPDEARRWNKYRQNIQQIEEQINRAIEPGRRCFDCGEPPELPL
jgi:hypothetical protein